MQTLAKQNPNQIRSQTRSVAVLAVLLFALSGLISGFTVGVFLHPKARSGGSTSSNNSPSVGQQGQTPVKTKTNTVVLLGEPELTLNNYSQVADGSTAYTLSASIIDKSGKPIQAPDVTCKVWLTKDGNINEVLSANNYAIPRSISAVQQPFPHEIQDGFDLSSTTQQVRPCTANGKTAWNYTLSPSLHSGAYYLAVIADWKGQHFNWSWLMIKIKKKAGD